MGFLSKIFGGGGSSTSVANTTNVNTQVQVNPSIGVTVDTDGIEALVSKFSEDEAAEREQLATFLEEINTGQKANVAAQLVSQEQTATAITNIMLLGLGLGAMAIWKS